MKKLGIIFLILGGLVISTLPLDLNSAFDDSPNPRSIKLAFDDSPNPTFVQNFNFDDSPNPTFA